MRGHLVLSFRRIHEHNPGKTQVHLSSQEGCLKCLSELQLAGGRRQGSGAFSTRSSCPNWSRNSYICDVFQLLIGNVAIGFWCANMKESLYLWDRDILDQFYTVVWNFNLIFMVII